MINETIKRLSELPNTTLSDGQFWHKKWWNSPYKVGEQG